MITTSYIQELTFRPGYIQQYRIQKYFRDIINNWFADQRNIKDERLVGLLYDSDGNLNENCIKTGTPFDPDGKYAGTTPAVIVSLGLIKYTARPVNRAGNPCFINNPTQAPIQLYRLKNIDLQITVITLGYDGTILLTELLLLFLSMNSLSIVKDCRSLSYMNVASISAPQAIQQGASGNAKKLYASTIAVNTVGYITWTHDTQGPIFKGILVKTTYK